METYVHETSKLIHLTIQGETITTTWNHQVEIVETPETVYNFQVEDFHTYHVGNAGVLVHNANCSSGGYTGGRSEQELKELAEDPINQIKVVLG